MKNPSPSPQSSQGKFISCNVKLEPHEIDTINFFVNLGELVEQILPSNTKYTSRPDIFMRGLAWEMKSPTSSNANALSHLFYKAVQQSPNIIFDLRRLKSQNTATALLKKLFHNSRQAKNLLIITQQSKLLEFHKK